MAKTLDEVLAANARYASLDNPRDITEKYDVVIGNIERGLVADPAGKVYGAYSTK